MNSINYFLIFAKFPWRVNVRIKVFLISRCVSISRPRYVNHLLTFLKILQYLMICQFHINLDRAKYSCFTQFCLLTNTKTVVFCSVKVYSLIFYIFQWRIYVQLLDLFDFTVILVIEGFYWFFLVTLVNDGQPSRIVQGSWNHKLFSILRWTI